MKMAAPSGIVTFLFTDIEGSTQRWEADAEAMRAALATHNQALREAIEAHDGQVFNYTGDGMCAVFASPRNAVDSAVAAQLVLQLPVRMGAQLALSLSRLAATHGEPLDALDYVTLTIRSHYDSGSIFFIIQPLAVLAALLDRLGRHESAATISGFAATPLTRAAYPEVNTAITHLREVLGDQAYESLAHAGENMTTSAMATYAFDQIDRARAQLLRG